MKKWYSVKALAGKDDTPPTAEVFLFDEIGRWGVTAREFIDDVRATGAAKVKMLINSPGGNLFDALAIRNFLRTSGLEVEARVMGVAASAATVVADGAGKITMPKNTFWMVHNALGGAYGHAEDLREMAEVLDKASEAVVTMYVDRTGKTADEVRAIMKRETFLTAAEAHEAGFVDAVEDAVTVTAAFDLENMPEHVRAVFMAATPPSADADEPPADEPPADEPPADEPPAVDAAEQVAALAAPAGLADLAPVIALLPDAATPDGIKAAVARVKEIKALCAAANHPEMLRGFVLKNAGLADVRAALLDVLARQDEDTHTDNHQPTSTPQNRATQAAGFKPSDVWNARNRNRSTAK